MRDRPTGDELAILVQRIDTGDLNIEVPKDNKYRGRMLASAVEISKRQKETGGDPELQERDRLSIIMKQKGSLINLNQNLSEAIRKGHFNSETSVRDQVRNHLWLTTIDRVYESRPKVLKKLS